MTTFEAVFVSFGLITVALIVVATATNYLCEMLKDWNVDLKGDAVDFFKTLLGNEKVRLALVALVTAVAEHFIGFINAVGSAPVV